MEKKTQALKIKELKLKAILFDMDAAKNKKEQTKAHYSLRFRRL